MTEPGPDSAGTPAGAGQPPAGQPPAGQPPAGQPPPGQAPPAPRGGGYNTGTDADRRKALDSIYDYTKTVITVATGTVALTATFLGKDLYQGTSLGLIVASWTCLGVSILFGIVGMGTYISQYAESDIRPRRSGAEYASLVQVLGLVAGLVLLGLFALDNARSRPAPAAPAPATSVSPTGTPGPTR
jgi:hypothetical protein